MLYCTKLILTEFMKKMVSGVDDGSNAADGDQIPANNLYPLLMQHNEGSELWKRGKTILKIKRLVISKLTHQHTELYLSFCDF